MGKREEFLRFLFSIIWKKWDLKKIRELIWNQQELRLGVWQKLESHGSIYIHPLTAFRLGILDNQIGRLNLTLTTILGDYKPVERLMKIKISHIVNPGTLVVSRNDLFNLFRGNTPKLVEVQALIPSFVLRNEAIPIIESVKLSRIRQTDVQNNIRLDKKHIDLLVSKRSVFYKNDIVKLVDYNVAKDKFTNLYYKVEISTSPCLIDSTTSFYETASTATFVPFSNFRLKYPISDSIEAISKRMTQIYFAQKKIQQKPLIFFLSGASGSGKRLLSRIFASKTHRNMLEVDAYQLVSENPINSENRITAILEKANNLRHCVLYIRNSHILAYDSYNGIDRRILNHFESILQNPSKTTVILSCITDKLTLMSMSIKSLSLYSFTVDYLEEEDRIKWLTYFQPNDGKLVGHVAKKTSGFTLAELEELINNVKFKLEVEKSKKVTMKMFEDAIDRRNANFADAIGAPKIPNVQWNDVGGLEETKQIVVESIRTNLFGSRSLKRSGIILYGSPGCGKTLIAKAVATEFNIAFLSVKGPELLNKYVGQSEENLRKVFERAKQASPCVIFFDEIDSLAPNRGKNGDSGGVIDRIVSQLLAELDKLHNSPRTKVFVMGATNRPDLLDASLMIPGRFDKLVEVSPGKDVESKTKILEAISRKMNFDKDVDLREIASKVNDAMSGAQLFSIISNAAMQAVIETVETTTKKEELAQKTVQVSQRHLLESVQTFHKQKF